MKFNRGFKQWIAILLCVACMVTGSRLGVAVPVPATAAAESAAGSVNPLSSAKVLLVDDRLPWSFAANSTVLSSLGLSYDKAGISDFLSKDLGNYSVIVLANYQSFESLSQYSSFVSRVEDFASMGGTVIFNAVSFGYPASNLLPGGVRRVNVYGSINYTSIANPVHPIVTGELTDGVALTNDDMLHCSSACISFDASSFPRGYRVILCNRNNNAPTLVEYPVGNGTVIASGIPWEHDYLSYVEGSYGGYARKAMADLFMYAISVSRADIDMCLPLALSVSGGTRMVAGEELPITAAIKNLGDDMIEDVRLWIVCPYKMDVTNNSDERVLEWDSLDTGQGKSADWKIRLQEDYQYGKGESYADIRIKLEYRIPATGEVRTKEIVKLVTILNDDSTDSGDSDSGNTGSGGTDSVPNNAIIVIPGIVGTRLYANQEVDSKFYLLEKFQKNKHYFTFASGHQFWEPYTSTISNDFQSGTTMQNKIQSETMMLICDEAGNSLVDIVPESAVDCEGYGAKGTYTKLVEKLKETYGRDYSVDFFAYDWRKDVSKAAEELENYINQEAYDNVVLVCHSMGGLVASKYLANGSKNQEKVDKLITIGTPYLGAPKALYVFESGYLLDDTTSFFCMATPIKSIVNNITSCYELLPTQKYFDLNDTTYVQYQNNNGFWHRKSTKKLDYGKTRALIGERSWAQSGGTEKGFLGISEDFAESLFVNGEHITNTVDSYYIIGYGEDTILEVEEEYNKDGSFDKCRDLTVTCGGDDTVPVISANIGGLADGEKTYYIKASHAGMVKNSNVIALVENIINGEPDNYSDSCSKTCPGETDDKGWFGTTKTVRIQLKVECPVDLAMVDDAGDEWAYVNSEYVYNKNEEEGSFYLLGRDNDAKMAYLQDKNYNVKLIGTDTGTMRYTMSVYDAGDEMNRIVFDNVSITDTTVIYTNTDRHGEIVLQVDKDNDGTIDSLISPSYILDEEAILKEEDGVVVDLNKVSVITGNSDIGMQVYAEDIKVQRAISAEGKCELYTNGDVDLPDNNISLLYVNGQLKDSTHEVGYQEMADGIHDMFAGKGDSLPDNVMSCEKTDMVCYLEDRLSDFVTDNNIVLSVPELASDENCTLYSRNGNISIYASDVDFHGMIYAPNGTVTIYADRVKIKGGIIADKLIISGRSVSFE